METPQARGKRIGREELLGAWTWPRLGKGPGLQAGRRLCLPNADALHTAASGGGSAVGGLLSVGERWGGDSTREPK